MHPSYGISPGVPGPAGASFSPRSTNFAVYSQPATGMELLLYRSDADDEPFQIVTLVSPEHRHFYYWHVAVDELPAGTFYNWRVTHTDAAGLRQQQEVLDPFARSITTARWRRADWVAGMPLGLRGIVVPVADEPGPAPRGLDGAIIYELHVGGFTRHPSSGVRQPGTFSGLMEKIPYLQDLGITHVQLLPVTAFDEQDVPETVAALGLNRLNDDTCEVMSETSDRILDLFQGIGERLKDRFAFFGSRILRTQVRRIKCDAKRNND